MRTLIISLKFCEKNGTKYWFLYTNPSHYMSFASEVFCSITSITFPNFENVD